MTRDSDIVHDRENFFVLALNQALIGAVDDNIEGVALQRVGDSALTIFFSVERLDDDVREGLDDIVGDFEVAVAPELIDIDIEVHQGAARGGWVGMSHRLVYLRKSR